MAGGNSARIQISEERNYYFHSLIVCNLPKLKKRVWGEKPHIFKVRVFVDMWAIILSQQMNNQAVRAPNIALERRLEKLEQG